MKRLMPIVVLVLALAGCTAAPAGSGSAPGASAPTSATQTEAPAPAPSPTTLSTEEAASAYLDGVCPPNLAGKTFNDAYEVVVDAGTGADIAPLQTAAVALRDANQAAAVSLGSLATQWPTELQADMAVIAESYYRDLADIDQIIQADSADDIFAITFSTRTPEEKAAAPRVRTALGLDLDTQASCANR